MTELWGVPVGLSHLVHGAHTQWRGSWAEEEALTIHGCICWAGRVALAVISGSHSTSPCSVSQPVKSTQHRASYIVGAHHYGLLVVLLSSPFISELLFSYL